MQQRLGVSRETCYGPLVPPTKDQLFIRVERVLRANEWPAGANRDEVVRRVLAWDAQVARIRSKHELSELENSRQRLLPFDNSSRST